MKMYKIKKEAVPFILEKYATAVYSQETWENKGICINALEEVKPIFITYGKKLGENSKHLSGWGGQEGAHYHFTVHFPSMQWEEHDRFSNGRITRELMERIQIELNRLYIKFLNSEDITNGKD